MTVTVTAETVGHALAQLGHRDQHGIVVTWRTVTGPDYMAKPASGCIVDATWIAGEDVQRSFKTAEEALEYIGGILRRRDGYVQDEQAKLKAKANGPE